VALQLKRKGITRVHPLEGGLAGWMALGYPVRAIEVSAGPAAGPRPGALPSAAS